MTEDTPRKIITPLTIRIIAVQLLFLGLLFLPEYSLLPLKWSVAELSIVMKTFQEIVDNPIFYGLLMLITIILLFSFDVSVDEEKLKEGKISIGSLLVQSLSKILGIYLGLYVMSWLFLVYKLRFMGFIYINSLLIQNI